MLQSHLALLCVNTRQRTLHTRILAIQLRLITQERRRRFFFAGCQQAFRILHGQCARQRKTIAPLGSQRQRLRCLTTDQTVLNIDAEQGRRRRHRRIPNHIRMQGFQQRSGTRGIFLTQGNHRQTVTRTHNLRARTLLQLLGKKYRRITPSLHTIVL